MTLPYSPLVLPGGSGGGGSIGGSIAATQVAFGSAANTIAGSSSFIWNNTTKALQLGTSATATAAKLMVRETFDGTASKNIAEFNLDLSIPANSAQSMASLNVITSTTGGTDGHTFSGILQAANFQTNLDLAATTYSNLVKGLTSRVTMSGGTATTAGTWLAGVTGGIQQSGGTSLLTIGVSASNIISGGTVTTVEGIRTRMNFNGNAVVTTATALHVNAFEGVLTGSIDTAYGLKVDAPGMGTTQWTMAIDSGNSYILGPLTIGSASSVGVQLDVRQVAQDSNDPTPAFQVVGAAHTNVSASQGYVGAVFNFFQTVTFQTGDQQNVGSAEFSSGIFAFNGASTVDFAFNVGINGSPQPGANATFSEVAAFAVLGMQTKAGSLYSIFASPNNFSSGTGDVIELSTIKVANLGGNASLGSTNNSLTTLSSVHLSQITYDGTANTRTVTGDIATLLVDDAPLASTHVTFSATAYAIKIKAGTSYFGGRINATKGANVAAANNLTLGSDGNTFTITGNTQINAITTSGWTAGSCISLIFTGTPTVKHNTAGGAGTAPLFLSGSVDLIAANNTVLSLVYDGTEWQEIARKVA